MNTSCCNTPATTSATEACRTAVRTESPSAQARRPRYQIDNTAEAHSVRVELPGVARDAVNLNLDEGVLTLTATRSVNVPETWKPLHRELSDAGYELRLRLNDRVDESRLSAHLEDGVLNIVLPIKEAAKPRTIAIQ
jgi:HSP20 family protein